MATLSEPDARELVRRLCTTHGDDALLYASTRLGQAIMAREIEATELWQEVAELIERGRSGGANLPRAVPPGGTAAAGKPR